MYKSKKVGTTKRKKRSVSVSTFPYFRNSSTILDRPFIQKLCGPYNMPAVETALDIIIIFFAELFGTWFLVFLLCSGILMDNINKMAYSITYGMAMVVVVQLFGHISFCNVNPAISLAAVILGHFHVLMLPVYLISQVSGAILGAFVYYAFCPFSLYKQNNCLTIIGPSVSLAQALFLEFLLTGVYTLAYAVAFEKRLAFRHDSLPIRFGLVLFSLSMSGYEFTGCSINPVRSLGPAIVENYWKNHWIYWVGPISGSVTFAFLYRLIFRDRYEEN